MVVVLNLPVLAERSFELEYLAGCSFGIDRGSVEQSPRRLLHVDLQLSSSLVA